MKQNVFILIFKQSGYIGVYGSIARLFEDHGDKMPIALQTLYNSIDLEQEDYETETVLIAKRVIQRKKQNFL